MTQPDDPRSDDALMIDLRAGDASAFEVLYRRHHDWVVRLALRISGDEADALDVLQETFLYVLRMAPKLEARARFSTFLFPVVRNLALARRRKRARSEAAVDMPQEQPDAARQQDLVAALAGLPVEQRDTVLLRYVDGLSVEDIGTRLGVPAGTVKSRLHQALARLRDDPRARRYFLD